MLNVSCSRPLLLPSFCLHATATSEIYTLSLHDALPIFAAKIAEREQAGKHFSIVVVAEGAKPAGGDYVTSAGQDQQDRKSTRLNSSHSQISYAVFCLKKKI